jgi:nucleoid-associated protein YgaU
MPNRYEECDIITGVNKTNPDGLQKKVSKLSSIFYPGFSNNEDIFIVSHLGDRLDNLAYDYYGDPSYWFVLASVNNLGRGSLAIPPGLVIRIPYYDKITGIGALFQQYNFMR